ncbi:c-type cytochrome domain-containing protein [Zestomonas carbonaria]|uniref:Cytochrome c domain-containing protein n=1 Tax=Zestomonas carbonaria TaxID=2762745 RepID=A0A7U7ENA7_9GAMM|nr:c-type cytochrome domain-containing protein [Pseudomonas carbonaria]CAD5108158.1 hypothetical protein PSEWESI4_02443 [Pseudomonas carbonaria]
MPIRPARHPLLALALMLLAPATLPAAEPTYRDDIAPILESRCLLCHSGEQAPLGLRLDSLEHLLAGSQRGPVVQSGNPADSELIKRLKGTSQPRMPLTGPPFLDDREIALFETWIAGGLAPGAPGKAETAVAATPSTPKPGEAVNYSHIEAILGRRCAKCHSPSGLMGPPPEGYLLTSYAEALAFGERARIVPGSAEASEVVRRIRGQALPRMPLDGPPFLDEEEIALIVAWIDQGARDAQGQPAIVPVGARVRLHGRLDGRWQLDGLPLRVNAATRLDKSPQVGDYVQVRGRLSGDGMINVERLRPR